MTGSVTDAMQEPEARLSTAAVPQNGALVVELGRIAADMLRPLIRTDAPCALLDFPNHTNLGDSAIWLGQLALLRRLNVGQPRYICDFRSYSRARLEAQIGDGTILLAGGGNFGDLYPHHQELREAVIADFPHNPIVQLPQSIHFRRAGALEQVARACDAHPNFTLFVRDNASLALARRAFRSQVLLCPDMAFGLGPLRRRGEAEYDVVFVARRDREQRHGGPPTVLPPEIFRTDWLHEEEVFVHRIHSGLRRRANQYPSLDWLDRLSTRTYEPMAWHRVDRAVTILSRGRAVITDRLHAHILSLLLGIPHCVLDNSYGKVRGCWDTWTRGADLVRWCETEAEALQQVRELKR